MSQQIFNLAATLGMFSMAAAMFSLKKEYEGFRRDTVRIIGGLGILAKNNAQGMSITVTESQKDSSGENDR